MKQYRRTFANHVPVEVVPIDIVNKWNRSRKWEAKYYAEWDFVCISYDGTLGEILEIGGLLIGLPKAPKAINDNNILPKYQKWKRIEVPNELQKFQVLYNDLDYEKKQEKIKELFKKYESFIRTDIERCKKGHWFMNNGEPTYLTPGAYFFFQHYYHYEPKRYGDFRMTLRDYYYWLEACYIDHRCVGSLLIKNRGVAFSTTGASEIMRTAIFNENSFSPLVSKTDRDSEKLFVQKIREPFKVLPIHLQPESNVFNNELKALKLEDRKSKDGNSSYIERYPTTIDGYDGTRPEISLNDEIGKFNRFSVSEYWSIHKDCHTTGIGEVTGKAICGSTAGEFGKGGGKPFKELYDNSNINKRNPLGMTESGLYGLFIPAEFGQQGFYDEYGWVIYDTPDEPVMNEIGREVSKGIYEVLDEIEESLRHDELKLNSQKRKHPRKLSDAFKDEDQIDMFNQENLQTHEYYLKDQIKTPYYHKKVFRMNLFWKSNGVVEHRASDTVKFKVVWMPDKDDRNGYAESYGRRKPLLEHIGAFGTDPYYATKVIYGKGSSGAMLGLTKQNGVGFPTDTFFLMYEHRPKNEYEFYEDMIMASVYYSMPNLVERNKRGLLVYMNEKGYRDYALNRPDVKYRDLQGDDKSIGGWYSTKESIVDQENALESYIDRAIGQHSIDINDSKVYFPELIKSWQDYNPSEKDYRTKNDLSVASMFAIKANEKKIRKKEELEITEEINLTIFESAL